MVSSAWLETPNGRFWHLSDPYGAGHRGPAYWGKADIKRLMRAYLCEVGLSTSSQLNKPFQCLGLDHLWDRVQAGPLRRGVGASARISRSALSSAHSASGIGCRSQARFWRTSSDATDPGMTETTPRCPGGNCKAARGQRHVVAAADIKDALCLANNRRFGRLVAIERAGARDPAPGFPRRRARRSRSSPRARRRFRAPRGPPARVGCRALPPGRNRSASAARSAGSCRRD